jgi:hypothetical protein
VKKSHITSVASPLPQAAAATAMGARTVATRRTLARSLIGFPSNKISFWRLDPSPRQRI